jgi:hypothetical protein
MTKGNLTADAVEDAEEGLSPEVSRARARLRKLIDERGIKPITIEQLRAMGDVWPEDESVDEFLAWREERRRASRHGRIP